MYGTRVMITQPGSNLRDGQGRTVMYEASDAFGQRARRGCDWRMVHGR